MKVRASKNFSPAVHCSLAEKARAIAAIRFIMKGQCDA